MRNFMDFIELKKIVYYCILFNQIDNLIKSSQFQFSTGY